MAKVTILRDCFIFEETPTGIVLIGIDNQSKINPEKELEVPTLVEVRNAEYKSVRAIAPAAFFNSPIKKWCLPATINRIGENAFANSAVEQVRFYATSVAQYQSIVQVCDKAFNNCDNLKLFSTMQKIAAEERAFAGCRNLTTEKMRHEMRFSKISKDTFADCSRLNEIFISEGGFVWSDAFRDSAIRKLHIDKSVHLEQDAVNFIKGFDVQVITGKDCEAADLIYDGICVEVI